MEEMRELKYYNENCIVAGSSGGDNIYNQLY